MLTKKKRGSDGAERGMGRRVKKRKREN